jgi:integrase
MSHGIASEYIYEGKCAMAGRRASVNYWESRKAYGCNFKGVQYVLAIGPDDGPTGPTYQLALKEFTLITSLAAADTAGNKNTCRIIMDRYLCAAESGGKKKPATIANQVRDLKAFCKTLGDVPIKDLTQTMVDEWIAAKRRPGKNKHTGWSDGTVRCYCKSVIAALNWAVKKKLIPENPLKGMELPSVVSRGRLVLLGDTKEARAEAHRRILEVCSPTLRPLVILLEHTGCRPGEARGVTAHDFNAKEGYILYHGDDNRLEDEFEHKNSGNGKDRMIFMSGDCLEMMRELAKTRPDGPLFLTRHARLKYKHLANGWTGPSLTRAFRCLRKRLNIPNFIPYSYRHGFATTALESGTSMETLSVLMGNSPEVIWKHYSHLLQNPARLRNEFNKIRGSENGACRVPPSAV